MEQINVGARIKSLVLNIIYSKALRAGIQQGGKKVGLTCIRAVMKTHKCKTSSCKGEIMYSTEKIVHNTIVTLYDDKWLLDKLWYPIVGQININSLCKISEINIMLYVNSTIIYKTFLKERILMKVVLSFLLEGSLLHLSTFPMTHSLNDFKAVHSHIYILSAVMCVFL